MANSFRKFGINRLSVAKTAAIAELAIAAPELYAEVPKGGTLVTIAQRCTDIVKDNEELANAIRQMKVAKKLLPFGATKLQK